MKRSWRVHVRMPEPVVLHAWAAAQARDPEIEKARFAQAAEIAGRVRDSGEGERPERAGQQEDFKRNDQIADGIGVCDAAHHLRPRERTEDRVLSQPRHAQCSPSASERIPATIAAAPKITKQPTTTTTPRRHSTRPVSIMNPTTATAITAALVAT